MRRTTQTSSGVEVKVGRFNEPSVTVEVEAGSTVEDVLNKANISLGSAETIWVNGVKAELNDEPEAGDHLQIIGKKEGGC